MAGAGRTLVWVILLLVLLAGVNMLGRLSVEPLRRVHPTVGAIADFIF